MNNLKEFDIVPYQKVKKDPRQLLYHFPSLPTIKYAKMMDVYSHNKAIKAAQDVANSLGYLLIPFPCVHQKRAKKKELDNKKIRIGRSPFYLFKIDELTTNEKTKLINYITDIN